ncbi:sulfatase-like hydrolase/transferase [Spirillospora sp. NPDC029432]|uniref:sulfatase-like hydrolase/transferase n=1 Tax=Spirillospora sp. NPDC029432 TaxID=3154599 RepID=UPI003455EDA6
MLLAPVRIGRLEPEWFARIPVEALIAAFLVLVLPRRTRRAFVLAFGAGLGVLAILKAMDMGFHYFLARSFDPVLDGVSIRAGVEFVESTRGRASALGAVAGAVLLAVAVIASTTLAAVRLSRLLRRHRTAAAGAVPVLTAVWLAATALGAHLVPGVPLASKGSTKVAYRHTVQIGAGLHDRRAFAAEASVDAYRDVPGDRLLTALRGKDVLLAFVESYGRSAVEDPEMAPRVGALLADGDRRLKARGYGSRSAFLTSSTAGGGSWLAHATLLSGLWIDNEQRYRNLVDSDRLTLNRAFRRAGWRTVGVMPGVTRAWPEGTFFGYDRVYTGRDLGYRGPKFGWSTMPDQYTLSAFERLERGRRDLGPTMTEIPLLSSHASWGSIPRFIPWDQVGDGSVYRSMPEARTRPPWPGPERIRGEYRRSIEYSVGTLISYVENHGDDDLVVVFLGDHQPLPKVAGEGSGRDVPITVVARDRAVLDRISGWGWNEGLKPGPQAPVWRMSSFRDRFLAAFSEP